MAWIGVTDHSAGWFSLDGPSGAAGGEAGFPPGTLLTRGTLLVETRVSPDDRPQTLLAFDRSHPWPGRFSLQVLPGGSVVLAESQGADTRSAVLPCPYTDRTDIVRLTCSWDAPRRTGALTIERRSTDGPSSATLQGPRPMLLDDLRALMLHRGHGNMDRDVIFAALSTRIEPVGPMPGLTANTPIRTGNGETPVHRIRRGDTVITDRGEAVPVLQVIRRTVPARGSFRPVRLRAGYFGLTRDIVVAPDQNLVMRGSDVEYLFGREAVLVPARHLVNSFAAHAGRGSEMVTYYQLLLPRHDTLRAAGCSLASLFVGRLRRKPGALAASLLAPFDRARLPEHARTAWPVLRPFEAVTLATDRAA